MLGLLNCIFGKTALPSSTYLFRKNLPRRMKPNYHFFCSKCYNLLDEEAVSCKICNHSSSSNSKKKTNFFVTFPVERQLKSMIKKNLSSLTSSSNNREKTINDVNDGILHNKIITRDDEYPLSLTLNTDGIRVFKSSNKSELWPLQFHCNELPPEMRFNKNNIGICGFWFGKHPIVEIFLKAFIEEIKSISNNRLNIIIDGHIYKFVVQPIIFTLDIIAKDMLQSKIQFNGKFGCSYCLHPGTKVNVRHIRYVE